MSGLLVLWLVVGLCSALGNPLYTLSYFPPSIVNSVLLLYNCSNSMVFLFSPCNPPGLLPGGLHLFSCLVLTHLFFSYAWTITLLPSLRQPRTFRRGMAPASIASLVSVRLCRLQSPLRSFHSRQPPSYRRRQAQGTCTRQTKRTEHRIV